MEKSNDIANLTNYYLIKLLYPYKLNSIQCYDNEISIARKNTSNGDKSNYLRFLSVIYKTSKNSTDLAGVFLNFG